MNWQVLSAAVSAVCALMGSLAGVMRWAKRQAEEAAALKSRMDYLMLAVDDLREEMRVLQHEVAELQPGLMREATLRRSDHVIS